MNFSKKFLNFFMSSLETIVFVGSVYMVIYLFIAQPNEVQGASMQNTLHTGERLITSKITYRLHPPQYGDIVVVVSPKDKNVQLVKRVIALAGDTIEVRDEEVYVNGKKLTEPYISTKTNVWLNGYIKEATPIQVPQGYIFVMGDNRKNSSDSREFGPIADSQIIGKVVFRYFPFNKVGVVKHQ